MTPAELKAIENRALYSWAGNTEERIRAHTTDVAALLGEVERLKKERDEARKWAEAAMRLCRNEDVEVDGECNWEDVACSWWSKGT